MTTGERLKYIRRSQKISLDEAAEQSGISRSAIQRYESGEVRAYASEYMLFVAKLGYSLDWVLTGNGPDKKEIKPNLVTDLKQFRIENDALSVRLDYLERILMKIIGDDTGAYGSDIIKSRVNKKDKKVVN